MKKPQKDQREATWINNYIPISVSIISLIISIITLIYSNSYNSISERAKLKAISLDLSLCLSLSVQELNFQQERAEYIPDPEVKSKLLESINKQKTLIFKWEKFFDAKFEFDKIDSLPRKEVIEWIELGLTIKKSFDEVSKEIGLSGKKLDETLVSHGVKIPIGLTTRSTRTQPQLSPRLQ